MLLIAPVSISVMRQCNQDPVPLLISMVGLGRAGTRVLGLSPAENSPAPVCVCWAVRPDTPAVP